MQNTSSCIIHRTSQWLSQVPFFTPSIVIQTLIDTCIIPIHSCIPPWLCKLHSRPCGHRVKMERVKHDRHSTAVAQGFERRRMDIYHQYRCGQCRWHFFDSSLSHPLRLIRNYQEGDEIDVNRHTIKLPNLTWEIHDLASSIRWYWTEKRLHLMK